LVCFGLLEVISFISQNLIGGTCLFYLHLLICLLTLDLILLEYDMDLFI